MQHHSVTYTGAVTDFYFDATLDRLEQLSAGNPMVIVTDENLMASHGDALAAWPVITLPAGEEAKSLATAEDIAARLIEMDAGRDTLLVGVGGGVVSDITGLVAGIYKRGIRCGFVPASVLAMVDAAVGGKNGVNTGMYKNMIGLVRQPEFLLYDYRLLGTLPETEWRNGFAEIIKHACILDAGMFGLLEKHRLDDFRENAGLLNRLITRNALLKAELVRTDEFETGRRKLLNFGHTLAHAIEKLQQLPHGQAVAVGMAFAARLSQAFTGFSRPEVVEKLILRYGLPVAVSFDKEAALHLMRADKKKENDHISYILLEDIGKPVIRPLALDMLARFL